jgi:hypothetical protein
MGDGLKKTRLLPALGVAATTAGLLLATTGPASAATAIGTADDFFQQCDASVYVTDSLIGSSGKIEAWGGFVCPQSFKFVGQVRIDLKNGTKVVKTDAKNVNASTDSVNATVTNSSGVQSWHADLKIFRPGFDTWIVSTGVVKS